MAFNLRDHLRAGDFEIETAGAGVVHCRSLLGISLELAIRAARAAGATSEEVARSVLGLVARKTPRSSAQGLLEDDEGERLTPDELAAVSPAELESFAQRFVEKHQGLLIAHQAEPIAASQGESWTAFLQRALVHYHEEGVAARKRFLDSSSTSAIASATWRNQMDSERLDVLIRDLPQIRMPENPMRTTNNLLEDVGTRIEGLQGVAVGAAQVVQSLNVLAKAMQANYLAQAEKTSKETRNATRLAAASLFVSAIALVSSSYFSYRTLIEARDGGRSAELQQQEIHKALMEIASSQRGAPKELARLMAAERQAANASQPRGSLAGGRNTK